MLAIRHICGIELSVMGSRAENEILRSRSGLVRGFERRHEVQTSPTSNG